MDNSLNIGKLRHRINVIDYVESKNDLGEITKEPLVYRKLWAKIESRMGKESKDINDKVNNVESFKIKIRYCKGINSNMMIEFRGKQYFIVSIDNYNMLNKEMILEVINYRT